MDDRRLGTYRCKRLVDGEKLAVRIVLFRNRLEWAVGENLTATEYAETYGHDAGESDRRGVVPSSNLRGLSPTVDPVSWTTGRTQLEMAPEPWVVLMDMRSIKRLRGQIEQITVQT